MPKRPHDGSSETAPIAILVVGMHRSGTSALTRVVNLLGVDLPSELMPPVPGNNEPGFWESKLLREIHDQLLSELSSGWDNPYALPPGWHTGSVAQRYQRKLLHFLQSEFEDSNHFVIKDPRLCRLLPLWFDVLQEFGAAVRVLLPFRNPVEVALSLRARDKFSAAQSYLLWLRYVLEAEHRSRDMVRSFVSYTELLEDWQSTVRTAVEQLGIPALLDASHAGAAIDSFLSPEHRHQNVDEHELLGDPQIAVWVKRVYASLIDLKKTPDDAKALEQLDAIYAQLKSADLLYGALASEQKQQVEATTRALGKITVQSQHDTAELTLLQNRLAERDKQIESLEDTLDRQTQRLDSVNDHLAEQARAWTEANARINDRAIEIQALYGQLQAEQERRLKAERDVHDLEEKLLQKDQERDALSQQLPVETAAEIVQSDAELKKIQATLEKRARLDDQLRIQLRANRVELNKSRVATEAAERKTGQLIEQFQRLIKNAEHQLAVREHEQQRLSRGFENLRRAPTTRFGGLVGKALRATLAIVLLPYWLVSGRALAVVRRLRHKRLLARSPLFDASYYLMQNADVRLANRDPLRHYLLYGEAEGRDPHPLFDVDWYLAQNPEVVASGGSPLIHFVTQGAAERRNPHPLFDTGWYLDQYPDVAEAGVNPLVHYLQRGEIEKRNPNAVFDTSWYLTSYPEVADSPLDALVHYYRVGAREGKDPGPDFSTTGYLSLYPDVAEAGMNPLEHYLCYGQEEQRSAQSLKPSADPVAKPAPEQTPPRIRQQVRLPVVKEGGDYCAYTDRPSVESDVKLIAFYLPQFHPIPENDEWWGKGFTEWRNVTRAVPQFKGHYQPRLPGELGFYDLRLTEIQQRQIELARNYGIHGFCLHYYWFAGKTLLDRPLHQILNNPELDFPFCLCWANENWTRVWDGSDNEILLAQKHSAEDDLAFIRNIEPALRDPRYIRIDGQPLLIVYRPSLFPDSVATAKRWRAYCREVGLGELMLMCVQFDLDDPRPLGFDAAIEFPPHKVARNLTEITEDVDMLNPEYRGMILRYDDMVLRVKESGAPSYDLARGVCPSWDNEARRVGRSTIYFGSSPEKYGDWLKLACQYADQYPISGEKLVFVNAWNEWAEAAYLEPDQRYGYAYLNATADALETYKRGAYHQFPRTRRIVLVTHDAHNHGAQQNALHMVQCLHEHFHYDVDIITAGEGELIPAFEQYGQVHNFASGITSPIEQRYLVNLLREKGADAALCNTSVVGSVVALLKKAGLRVVSMVHELPNLIREYQLEDSVRQVAASADQIVFAADMVRDGFLSFEPEAEDKSLIRPQGLYKRPDLSIDRPQARAALRTTLGVPEESKIVLAAGWADLRKGIDVFMNVARITLVNDPDIAFVWLGCEDKSLLQWYRHDAETMRVQDRLFLLPRVDNIAEYYAAADVFLLPSREDPYPSVVLEAMSYGVPVVGFDGATGCAELIDRGGVLVPYLDESAMSKAVLDLTADPQYASAMGATGQRIVEEEFGWVDYMHVLLDLAGQPQQKVSVIIPNFNYARYLPQRLASVFGQHYPIYEVLVLDDASTDDSLQVLETLREEHGYRFRLLVNETNSDSVFKQWLEGARQARGDLVWIAEADDFAEPEFLGKVCRCFQDPEVVLAYSESKQIDEDGEPLADNYLDYVRDVDPEKWTKSYKRAGIDELRDSLVVKNTIPNVSAVLFRRSRLVSILEENLDFISSYKIAGDWATYALSLRDGKIAFVSEALNHHRRHQNSKTISNFNLAHLKEIASMQTHAFALAGKTKDPQTKPGAYLQKIYVQFGLASERHRHWVDHPELEQYFDAALHDEMVAAGEMQRQET